MPHLIPLPAAISATGDAFFLKKTTRITVDPDLGASTPLSAALTHQIQNATGLTLTVQSGDPVPGGIHLTSADADPALGAEGYALTITDQGITLRGQAAGIFYGIQTLDQLLVQPDPGTWAIPGGVIQDQPRFAYRGMMLDVARHFFGVDDVKRLIDLMALYKLNTLHLHLSDDQGWRLEIKSWPKLTEIGGSSAVDGDPGGYYTQVDYANLVAYAQTRFITLVPEIDMPSHTNAALASYADLNCDGVAPALYTGIKVGFSSLCNEKAITFQFVDDVIRELTALTPGPYLHIGGDEAHSTPKADYIAFVTRVQEIVGSHGKQMVGWEEISQIQLAPDTIAQQWFSDGAVRAVAQGSKIIASPASRIYLDMKYDDATPLGLNWAGNVSVEHSYTWDPATDVPGVGEADLLGVEAALWTETLRTFDDLAVMVFPRLLSLAEIGWTPQDQRNWGEYRERLAAHGPRLAALGVGFIDHRKWNGSRGLGIGDWGLGIRCLPNPQIPNPQSPTMYSPWS